MTKRGKDETEIKDEEKGRNFVEWHLRTSPEIHG